MTITVVVSNTLNIKSQTIFEGIFMAKIIIKIGEKKEANVKNVV